MKTNMLSGMKNTAALRKLTDDKLMEELQMAEKELYQVSMKHKLGELKQTHHIAEWKKYIAQMKTIQSELTTNAA